MFLNSFTLPIEAEPSMLKSRAAYNGGTYGYIDNAYPCGLFGPKGLETIKFNKITLFYGGNGSGKSTLLNLIAQKLQLKRIAPYNSSEMFPDYVQNCTYTMACDDEGYELRVPNGSRIITSDDIFDYMLTVRGNNDDISDNKEEARTQWLNLKFGDTVKFDGMQDYEALRMQMLARQKSLTRRQFIRRTAGHEAKLVSNGETAMEYFSQKLYSDTLYCLDEPENSLSPANQLKFVTMLEELAHYCGCQFIIATHSPFILAARDALVYDLDAVPVCTKNWWQLDNPRLYYDFFSRHRQLFE